MTLGSRRAFAKWVMVFSLVAHFSGCSGEEISTFGDPVNIERAVSLKALFSEYQPGDNAPVVVSGSIGQVCRSAGCWFVLQDDLNGERLELVVDLKPAATFTLDQRVIGRRGFVQGRLKGSPPDIKMWANGLVLE